MIVFLDGEAFLRLYVHDRGREWVLQATRGAEALAAALPAYPWLRARLAAMARDGDLAPEEASLAATRLDLDWSHTVRVPATPDLFRTAGELAGRWALDAVGALELASALALAQGLTASSLALAVLDRRLAAAAAAEGLEVLALETAEGAS